MRPLIRILGTCLLLTSPAWAQGVPYEAWTIRDPDLVEVTLLSPGIRLDIRYATGDNFLGRPVYPEARAFLARPAAEALARVQARLAERGWGLVVLDAYRPWCVTKLFWDETPEELRMFVADPARGSRHNRGCAIDVTLLDLWTGELAEMPCPYDEFSERAHPGYGGGTQEARCLRDLLRAAMEAQGFAVHEAEWWHFDYRGWENHPVLDLDFSQIGGTATATR